MMVFLNFSCNCDVVVRRGEPCLLHHQLDREVLPLKSFCSVCIWDNPHSDVFCSMAISQHEGERFSETGHPAKGPLKTESLVPTMLRLSRGHSKGLVGASFHCLPCAALSNLKYSLPSSQPIHVKIPPRSYIEV